MDVREAALEDVDAIVALIEARRQQLAEWEPRFWRKSETSAAMSEAFLPTLIDAPDATLLVLADGSKAFGCLQFKSTFVPPVYEPGGTTWMVDDFVVADNRWDRFGLPLLLALRRHTVDRQAGQLVFPVPYKDDAAMDFFKRHGLSPTTLWWTANSTN